MSASVHMTVDIRDLSAALGRLGDGLARALDDAALAGGLVVEGAAKQNIIRVDFIDTGATLNSTAARAGNEAGEVEVGPATEYAIFGELGIGQSEKRFLRDALDDNRGDIAAAVAEALRDAIRRAV